MRVFSKLDDAYKYANAMIIGLLHDPEDEEIHEFFSKVYPTEKEKYKAYKNYVDEGKQREDEIAIVESIPEQAGCPSWVLTDHPREVS